MHAKALAYKGFLDSLTVRQKVDFARAKRFLERWSGDPDFRNGIDLADGSREFIHDTLGFDFDVTELAPVIDVNAAGVKITENDWPLVHLWHRYISSATKFRDELRVVGNSGGITPNFDSWRSRQMNRAAFELGVRSMGIVHAPIVFELSDGCSVGCWFCGISAGKFKGHFDLGVTGALQLWRDVLAYSKELLGEGVSAGFCYWATDPLDNPYYCELADEFAQVVGSYPQITTAIPLKDVDLTRRALKGGKGLQLFPNRFSVLTTTALRKIHQSFSPDELLSVELVLQNKGALQDAKAVAGKVRLKHKAIPIVTDNKVQNSVESEKGSGTIACVSGFLVNMVSKTVRLIAPTSATDEIPDGYYVIDQIEFTNAENFRAALQVLVQKHMNPKISTVKKVKFIKHVEVINGDVGIELSSTNFKTKFPHSDDLVNAISQGFSTPKEIIKSFASKQGDPLRAVYLIDSLWKSGLIESVT